jgi:hypothetical protein
MHMHYLLCRSPLAQMLWAHSPSKACNFIVQWINTEILAFASFCRIKLYLIQEIVLILLKTIFSRN